MESKFKIGDIVVLTRDAKKEFPTYRNHIGKIKKIDYTFIIIDWYESEALMEKNMASKRDLNYRPHRLEYYKTTIDFLKKQLDQLEEKLKK